MNKTTIIAIISLFALLISQGYWLHSTYQDFKEKQQILINDLFITTIDNEAVIRFSDNPISPHNMHIKYKKAKDMTPEERASLKGDSINLDEAAKKNIGKSLSEIFTQTIQDDLFFKKPICIEMLDTLFNIELEKKDIHTSFLITLYDKNYKEANHIYHAYNENEDYILTKMHPIGTKGLLFVQAQVALPPYIIFEKMLYAFVISILIICITFYCIGHQLYIIRRTRRQLKEREELVYGAIHDLKKPLNGVFGILDFMKQTEKEKDILQIIELSKKQVRKLTDTIESMLWNIKNEYQTVELHTEEINLVETIRQIEKELKPLFKDKNYTFLIENPDQIQMIQTDTVRLERCLRNLIENALKYSDNNVTVKIILTQNAEQYRIAIQDNGWGIPLKAQKHIGKQFFRAKQNNKPQQEGYGIGLSSVGLLVRELNGKFTFESKEGSGSTFFINLPRTIIDGTNENKKNIIYRR